jgi:hypothetical protein
LARERILITPSDPSIKMGFITEGFLIPRLYHSLSQCVFYNLVINPSEAVPRVPKLAGCYRVPQQVDYNVLSVHPSRSPLASLSPECLRHTESLYSRAGLRMLVVFVEPKARRLIELEAR